MNTLTVSGLLLALLVIVICWRRFKRPICPPYDVHKTLLTLAEQRFLAVLEEAMNGQTRVFTKISANAVLMPQSGLSKAKWQQHASLINGKHFDYVLCHPVDLSFLCVIALDDSAHRHQKLCASDLLLKEACERANLPYLQIPTSADYFVAELREQILPLLTKSYAPALEDELSGGRREPTFNPLLLDEIEMESEHHDQCAPAAAAFAADRVSAAKAFAPLANIAPVSAVSEGKKLVDLHAMMDDFEQQIFAHEDEEQVLPHCPDCDAPLIEREVQKGIHAGRLFLMCSRFPACRYATSHHH
ncbi:MAG: DUF2726 domain-containing protein [Aeromonas sp.]